MEFTKIEQGILSTKHEKFQRVTLWIGILFLILSIAPVPYEVYQINKARKTLEESYSVLNQNIKTETNQEVFLKSMLLRNINETKEIMVSGLTQKIASVSILFFFMGCYCILIYFISRNYLRLIRKLQNS